MQRCSVDMSSITFHHLYFFFFSSRRRHTRLQGDWSSDVCSSDLRLGLAMRAAAANPESARLVGIRVGWMIALGWGMSSAIGAIAGMLIAPVVFLERSEERRVGKECRSRGSPDH